MKTLIVAIALFCSSCMGSCISEKGAVNAALALGMKDVHVISKNVMMPEFSGCSKSDDVAFKVEATNGMGQRVRFTVCEGIIKGATIRF